MKRLFILILALAVTFVSADAQILKRLGQTAKKAAERAAERAVERKVEQKVDEHVSKALDKADQAITEGVSKKNDEVEEEDTSTKEKTSKVDYSAVNAERRASNEKLNYDEWDITAEDKKGTLASPQQPAQPARATTKYNKFDFVAGDEIIFEDNLAGEQLGEFPSQWDLIEGVAEVAQVDGQNVIALEPNGHIRPFMDPILNYLGDVFTIEFDYYQQLEQEGEGYGFIYLYLYEKDENSDRSLSLSFRDYYDARYYHKDVSYSTTNFRYDWVSTNDDKLSGENKSLDLGVNNWVHVSLSFNKRALKIYINETRIANVPNMTNKSGWLAIERSNGKDGYPSYIRNVRIAKGAVPLYDRMMSDGKFITYGITFDVGKSTIKDESMGEINRIVKMMTDNADLKFSVEGHTDNTGNAANNQKLSEDRSKAIVDKLVGLGIAADRLTSTGKGQNSPIADNGTEEGRAKNRRVEFVKK